MGSEAGFSQFRCYYMSEPIANNRLLMLSFFDSQGSVDDLFGRPMLVTVSGEITRKTTLKSLKDNNKLRYSVLSEQFQSDLKE
jgi:hypothetical protein